MMPNIDPTGLQFFAAYLRSSIMGAQILHEYSDVAQIVTINVGGVLKEKGNHLHSHSEVAADSLNRNLTARHEQAQDIPE